MSAASALGRLKGLLSSPAVPAFVIKGGNAASAFLAAVVLARLTGAETVGHYALATATATLVGIGAVAGLDQVLVRGVAGDLRVGHSGRARATFDRIVRTVGRNGLLLALLFLVLVLSGLVAEPLGGQRSAFLAAVPGVVAAAFFRLGLGAVRAAGRALAAQALEALPSALLLLSFAALWLAGRPPSAPVAVLLFYGTWGLTSAACFALVGRDRRGWGASEPVALGPLQRAGLPLMAAGLLQAFADWFVLAAVGREVGAAEAGAFRVVAQIMLLFGMLVAVSEGWISARVAGDLRTGNVGAAWRRHRRAALATTAAALPLLALAILAPGWLLGSFFGPDFRVAATALVIMSFGQLANVALGPNGTMLAMNGNGREVLIISSTSTAMLAVFALLLMPRLGLEGAALAYSSSILLRKVLMAIAARRAIR